jgi:hypothetical protein
VADLFLERRPEADFQAWRAQQASTAEKYRRFDWGERMPCKLESCVTAIRSVIATRAMSDQPENTKTNRETRKANPN